MLHAIQAPAEPHAEYWWQTGFAGEVRSFAQRKLFWPIFRRFCSTHTVEGAEFLSELDEPVIFVANHSSHADTVMILSALPSAVRRRITVAAARDYFYRGGMRTWIVSLFLNTFPFDRRNGRAGLRDCAQMVRGGWSILIYPEGTRSNDGTVGAFKKGIGALAARLGTKVVPVYIEGPSKILPKGVHLPVKTDVRVRFGQPVRYSTETNLQAIADDLRQRVLALSDSGERIAA